MFRVTPYKVNHSKRYDGNTKYCPECMTFYYTDDVYCRVCHTHLRASPKKKKNNNVKRIAVPEEILREVGLLEDDGHEQG